MEPVQRTRLASLGIVSVVFASGAIVGFAVGRSDPPAAEVAEAAASPPDSAQESRDGRRRRPLVYEQVEGLTQVQLDSIGRIVSASRDSSRALARAYEADVDSLVAEAGVMDRYRGDRAALNEATLRAIKDVMTPDQAARYDELRRAAFERNRAERERQRSDDRRN